MASDWPSVFIPGLQISSSVSQHEAPCNQRVTFEAGSQHLTNLTVSLQGSPSSPRGGEAPRGLGVKEPPCHQCRVMRRGGARATSFLPATCSANSVFKFSKELSLNSFLRDTGFCLRGPGRGNISSLIPILFPWISSSVAWEPRDPASPSLSATRTSTLSHALCGDQGRREGLGLGDGHRWPGGLLNSLLFHTPVFYLWEPWAHSLFLLRFGSS